MYGKNIAAHAASIAATIALVACGQKSGDQSTARSPEEALAKLSGQHRQNFENWKNRPFKSCLAADAFGLQGSSTADPEGVDGAALVRQNGGSLAFGDGSEFAIISSMTGLSGVSQSKAEEKQDDNGATYSISAAADRSGSNCAISVYGQKVYETQIAATFMIGASWAKNKPAQAAARALQLRPLLGGLTEAMGSGAFPLIMESLRPSRAAIAPIARKLGVDEAFAAKYFQFAPSAALAAAVRFSGDAASVWTGSADGALIASEAALRTAFGGGAPFALDVRLVIPQFTFGEVANVADAGSWRIEAAAIARASGDGYVYSWQTFAPTGQTPADEKQAIDCVASRGRTLLGARGGSDDVRPSPSELFAPCLAIHRQAEALTYDTGAMAPVVVQALERTRPSATLRYNGWDEALMRLAIAAAEKGDDVANAIDPGGRVAAIALASRDLDAWRSELSLASPATRSLKNEIYRMSLQWALEGRRASAARDREIRIAIDNVADVFAPSTIRMVRELARSPDVAAIQVAFAADMNPAYKREAARASALATELGDDSFASDVAAQILQSRPSLADLRAWSSGYELARSETAAHPGVSSVKGSLGRLAVKWSRSGVASDKEIDSVYASIANVAPTFPASVAQLISELMRSTPQASREALAYAAGLAAETKSMMVAIRDNATALGSESFGKDAFDAILQKRPSAEQIRAWNATWSAASAFSQRERARAAGDAGIPEWDRRDVVQRGVQEAWTDVEFTGLEKIAEAAHAQSSCDRLKAASSRAKCANNAFFSKQKGMFFDPAFSGRYVAFGEEMAGYVDRLSAFEWTNLRWDLGRAMFGGFEPIWSKCDAPTFSAKRSELHRQIDAIVSERDQFRKWEIERQIKSTVENCR